MSISILNRGGASGGLKPELTVTAPSGSTIDLLKNGIVVATYTLDASETEHTFIVKVGAYTVRGTLDGNIKSVEVLIDVVGQYSVTLPLPLLIYRGTNSGESYYSVGWQYKNGVSYGTHDYMNYTEARIYGLSTGTGGGCRYVQFDQQIDFNCYGSINYLAVLNNSSSTETICQVSSSYSSAYDGSSLFLSSVNPTRSSSEQIVTFDVSDLTVQGYLSVRVKMQNCEIRKIWLE